MRRCHLCVNLVKDIWNNAMPLISNTSQITPAEHGAPYLRYISNMIHLYFQVSLEVGRQLYLCQIWNLIGVFTAILWVCYPDSLSHIHHVSRSKLWDLACSVCVSVLFTMHTYDYASASGFNTSQTSQSFIFPHFSDQRSCENTPATLYLGFACSSSMASSHFEIVLLIFQIETY